MITVITSADNRTVKMAASLSEKKYRDREGLYLAEGPNLVRDALSVGKARFIFLKAESESEEAAALAGEADSKGLAVYRVSNTVFGKISDTNTPQDILAAVEKPQITRDSFFEACGDGNVLVLDRVQDPGNVGTLLRSAEAAGFRGALVVKGSGDPFSPKAVRASASSCMRLPLILAESISDALAILKSRGKRVFASAMNEGTVYYRADLRKNAALVVSNEGNGASGELLEAADEILNIPMSGEVESLNAALAAGVIMFESRRQQNE